MPRELRSKARARDSRSRDRRRRRGSRDRDRGAPRDRQDTRTNEAQPPFSIFPRSEPSDSGPSLRLTPNTEHRSRSQERSPSRTYEQDLTTWHNIDAPPIRRRVPLQVGPIDPPPVAVTIHPNRSMQFDFNRAPPREEQEFFYRLLQSINPSGPAPVTTDPPVNIQYFQPQRQVLPSSDHRTPPASRSRSPTLASTAPRESRERRNETLTIPDFLRPRQHQASESGTETDHHRRQSDSSVPARTGSQWTYKLEQQNDGHCRITLKVQTEIPILSSSVFFLLKIVLGTLCTRWTSTCLGLTTRSANSVIVNKLQTTWSTFGSKNHIAGSNVINWSKPVKAKPKSRSSGSNYGMHWINGKQKPTAEAAACMRHTNSQHHDSLPKPLIRTSKITFSKRFRR